jgi:uncharacterized protein (TIGR02271 family)
MVILHISEVAMPPSEQDRTRPAPRRSQPSGCPRRSICSPVAPPGADSGAPAHHPDHHGGIPAMEAARTREYVDRRYEDRDVDELPDAPVEALRGLGKRSGEALRKALRVKTIRDLATNDFVLKAQEILRLAEGPTAIPTSAPASVAATSADAAIQQRERAGQQALTRSEEELEVDTKQVPRGQAGVRKRVVTEQQHRTVPVEREELRVQREPIPAGEGDGDAELAADERTMELREEQPVVDKRVVPKERVQIGKEVVRDHKQVSEPVRKEQVEVDQPDGER